MAPQFNLGYHCGANREQVLTDARAPIKPISAGLEAFSGCALIIQTQWDARVLAKEIARFSPD